MNLFTEVYQKTIDILRTMPFDNEWKEVAEKLRILLHPDGPDATKAVALDYLRTTIRKKAKSHTPSARADVVIDAADSTAVGFQERAAMLKTLQHFYLTARRGGQSLWVVDSPKQYSSWAYDELAGKTQREAKSTLEAEEEVYGAANRKMMAVALQTAQKWAMDCQIKLATPDQKTREKIRRWFHQDNTDPATIEASRLLLLTGFKNISAACNSSRVIFSDRPHLRVNPKYANTYASVNSSDSMPVIYIYEAFIKSGKRNIFGLRPEMWNCAITIIHELSHKIARTVDVKYVFEGMKPGRDLTEAEALNNAESWAFFCADMIGVIKKASLIQALE
jgi:hypothetical protein